MEGEKAEEKKVEGGIGRPEMPKAKTRQIPGVGRIVLVKTNDGERPMLITKVWNPNTVNGIIFLDGWNDRGLPVTGVREGSLLSHTTSIVRGSEANQWRFYDD
jgi:hypothetical protein